VLGIETSIDDIVNPVVTVPRLRTHHPDAGVFVIGEEPLKRALTAAGIRLTDDPEQIDIEQLRPAGELDRRAGRAKRRMDRELRWSTS
jgi:ribonucleotide monophosphatase NagD (HAD superfamily)